MNLRAQIVEWVAKLLKLAPEHARAIVLGSGFFAKDRFTDERMVRSLICVVFNLFLLLLLDDQEDVLTHFSPYNWAVWICKSYTHPNMVGAQSRAVVHCFEAVCSNFVFLSTY